jgi:hypothetical protein
MRVSISFVGALAVACLAAATAQAQYVSMSGEYTEANGPIVNIPVNQPLQLCKVAGTGFDPNINDARCRGADDSRGIPGITYQQPVSGVPVRDPAQPTVVGGLGVGEEFKIPPFFFSQQPPSGPAIIQGGPVIGAAVDWISSAYYAQMPNVARGLRPNLAANGTVTPNLDNTRVFKAWPAGPIPGQTGRELEPTAMTTGGATQVVHAMNNTGSADIGTMTYTEGPNRFGGTMALLLDGFSDLTVRAFGVFDGYFPTAVRPVVAMQRAGEYASGGATNYNTRNGVGWEVPILGGQGIAPAIGLVNTVGTRACDFGILPPQPVGCNEPVQLPILLATTLGKTVDPTTNPNGLTRYAANSAYFKLLDTIIPPATSTKYVFPFTTGTVAIVVNANRGSNGGTFVETLTGMGYDTVTTAGNVRNVGLVAGSYTNRTSDGNTVLNSQILGMNLQFTEIPVPEPGSTVALIAGVGLLAAAARRRRA